MRRSLAFARLVSLALIAGASSCGGETTTGEPARGTTMLLDLSLYTSGAAIDDRFFDLPYPLDLRLVDGRPDLDGFPNPSHNKTVTGLLDNAKEQAGFPVIPVVYMRFDGPIAQRTADDVVRDLIPADPSSPILLLDVDPASSHRGELIPTLAQTLEVDAYSPEHTLAIAPRPGFVLRPKTTYAAVVRTSALDADDEPLGVSPVLTRLRTHAPKGEAEQAASGVYEPLWETLDQVGVDPADVAGATVFTTGDVVAWTYDLTERVRQAYDVTITDLAINTLVDEQHPDLCEIKATVSYPQFQRGTKPYNTDGRFVFDDAGVPSLQGMETAQVSIAIPRKPMPEAGYPLAVYEHGTYRTANEGIQWDDETGTKVAIGPAVPLAEQGIAMATSSMPMNPERYADAKDPEYINAANLAVTRDIFRQGVVEQRLFFDALFDLRIDPAVLASCAGASLPAGQTHYHFDPASFVLTGQSMGGMYANFLGAMEPRVRALVPTGAGGDWTYFVLHSTGLPVPGSALKILIGTSIDTLTFLHPAFSIAAAALEPADPMVYMPRVSRRPLPGFAPRPIYEPVAPGDRYFPEVVYDAMALAYGHQQAGEELWPMQDALKLAGLDGLQAYPVQNNLTSETGAPYTGVVVQWEGDGVHNPHSIYTRREEVKYQYTCFFDGVLRHDVAEVLPPKKWSEVKSCP